MERDKNTESLKELVRELGQIHRKEQIGHIGATVGQFSTVDVASASEANEGRIPKLVFENRKIQDGVSVIV